MAHIRFPKDGNLQLDIHIYGHRFRETTGLANTPSNVAKLKKRVKKIDAEIALGTFEYRHYFPNSKKNSLFKQIKREKLKGSCTVFFDEFMCEYVERNKHQWRDTYIHCLQGTLDNYVLPFFGEKRVEDVTLADAQRFRDELCNLKKDDGNRKLSNKRINAIMVPVISLMHLANHEFDIPYPFERLKPLREEPSDPKPLTQQEVDLFLDTVDDSWRDYYILRFFTGMRSCEVHGLLLDCIDFEHRRIMVRRNYVNDLCDVKTRKSRRDIHMTPTVYDALKRTVDAMPAQSKENNGFLFTKKNGKALTTHFIARSIWYPTLEKAGLERRRPYQTRHTAAVLHLAAHENPLFVSQKLGHSGTRMLYEVYAPYVQNITQHDGSAFERMMTENKIRKPVAANDVLPFVNIKKTSNGNYP